MWRKKSSCLHSRTWHSNDRSTQGTRNLLFLGRKDIIRWTVFFLFSELHGCFSIVNVGRMRHCQSMAHHGHLFHEKTSKQLFLKIKQRLCKKAKHYITNENYITHEHGKTALTTKYNLLLLLEFKTCKMASKWNIYRHNNYSFRKYQ